MTHILKINPTGQVIDFLKRYEMWKDFNNLHQSFTMPVVEISENGIPCFVYHDIKSINASTAPLIAIDCLGESGHSKTHFLLYDPKKKYIIFSNGTWDKEYHKLKIDYVLIQSFFWLYNIADYYLSPNRFHTFFEKSYDFDCDKPNIFTSLIGAQRRQRTFVVEKLLQLNITKPFVIKYAGRDYGAPSTHLDVIPSNDTSFDVHAYIAAKHWYFAGNSLPTMLYNSGHFHILVETDLDMPYSFHFSEKGVKMFLTGTPFIAVSQPKYLENIRKLGFQTYNTLWDESYDQEYDYKKRVEMVVDLANDLCNFDWQAHKHQLEMIKFHNRSVFFNLHRIINREFQTFETTIQKLL